MQRWRSSVVALLASVVAFPAFAQDRSPLSLDFTAGASVGRGGEVARSHAGLAVDGIADWRARSIGGASVLLGLSGSIEGPIAHSDVCRAVGFQARVDVATAPWHHVAFVASLRGALLPQFRNSLYTLGALGFGVRLQ